MKNKVNANIVYESQNRNLFNTANCQNKRKKILFSWITHGKKFLFLQSNFESALEYQFQCAFKLLNDSIKVKP